MKALDLMASEMAEAGAAATRALEQAGALLAAEQSSRTAAEGRSATLSDGLDIALEEVGGLRELTDRLKGEVRSSSGSTTDVHSKPLQIRIS